MSDYFDYTKLWLKKYVQENSDSSIFTYKFEISNDLSLLPLNIQVETINQEILKYRNLLNTEFSLYTSYNFKNGNFDEDFYLENQVGDFLAALNKTYCTSDFNRLTENIESSLNKASELLENDDTEFSKVVRKIVIDYVRSKFIDALTTKRQEISENNETLNANTSKNDLSIDLSDSKGTEKIIMLEQLGILDFLSTKEPFNISKNALASALSGITGIDQKTIQSYINPINNPSADQKNNPLLRTKTVDKVNQKLISIGFKPQQ
jgi:hypothetical protein